MRGDSTTLRRWVLGSCLALSLGTVHAQDLATAMARYQKQEFAAATRDLSVAASAGDPVAQEMLGFVLAVGPALYPGVAQDLPAAMQWFALASQSGRPVAQWMSCKLSARLPPPRAAQVSCGP